MFYFTLHSIVVLGLPTDLFSDILLFLALPVLALHHVLIFLLLPIFPPRFHSTTRSPNNLAYDEESIPFSTLSVLTSCQLLTLVPAEILNISSADQLSLLETAGGRSTGVNLLSILCQPRYDPKLFPKLIDSS